MWLVARVKNISREPAYVTPLDPDFGFLHIIVTNDKGDTLPIRVSASVFILRDTPELLQPQEELLDVWEIYPWFDLKPGMYKISSELTLVSNYKKPGQSATIRSNEVVMRVHRRTPEEEQVQAATAATFEMFKERKTEAALKRCYEIMAQYPDNPFVINAYEMAASTYRNHLQLRDDPHARAELIKVTNDFFKKYPNSPLCDLFIYYREEQEKGKERKQFYEEVAALAPGTLTGEIATYRKERWKHGKLYPKEKFPE